jgi:chemotaxis protein histidine kinase CheA
MSSDEQFREQLRDTYAGLAGELSDTFEEAYRRLRLMPANREAIETARRLAHNIKGTGASYGYPLISDIGAHMDARLKPYVDSGAAVPEAELDHLDNCRKVLHEAFGRIERREDDLSGLRERFNEVAAEVGERPSDGGNPS